MAEQQNNPGFSNRPGGAWRALWTPTHVLGSLAALWIAWWLLAQASFLYPLWYDWLSIDAHIAEYGPENRYRYGFARTSRDERERLFDAILESIHEQGRGLETLRYHGPDGEPLGLLLRPPEVQHLKDVARLVEVGRVTGLLSLLLWLVCIGLLLWRRVPLPALRGQLLGLGVGLTAGLLLLLLLGPVRVFYVIHEWIFPPGHQWFFYYQESLMTTLMKAPDLFGGMAASWALLALVLIAAQTWLLRRLLRLRLMSTPA